MKKKIISAISGAVLLSSVAVAIPEAPANPVSSSNHEAKAEGKVLSKHTLSKKTVKSSAKSMKANANSAEKWAGVASALFKKYQIPVNAATLAGTAGQQEAINTFNKAAKQNKRVQVIVKSGPTPNLSKVSYKIVN